MSPSAEPEARLSHLPQADGSATFSHNGFTIVAAVNGPIEIQRRDENPFEAVIDVNVRPVAGVGGTGERQLENILQQALRQLVPIRDFPRSMIQVTLQVTEEPQDVYANFKTAQARLKLSLLPALLHTALLGFLTGAVPLKGIATATCLAVHGDARDGRITMDPTAREADTAESVHVVAFTGPDKLLLHESEGSFSPELWGKVLELGEKVCCQDASTETDVAMEDGVESRSVRSFVRSVLKLKSAEDLYWK